MNQISSPSTPASAAEISDALQILFDALPFQRGANSGNVAIAYIEALRGMTASAVTEGIRKFLRGDCEGVSPRFVPTPPELARIVRTAVVPSRVPEERRIAPFRHSSEGERARMRLKMPMFAYAFPNQSLIAELARANAAGLDEMVLLASKWGITIPDELINQTNADWHRARNLALAEIDRNPPPYMCVERARRRHDEAA